MERRILVLCRDYGGKLRFSGQVSTVKCFENNPLVRKVRASQRQFPRFSSCSGFGLLNMAQPAGTCLTDTVSALLL